METVLLIAAALLFFSILGSIASDKMGVPALILFLLIGIICGAEGIGWFKQVNSDIAQKVGVIALSFILFAGGFGTQLKVIRPVLFPGTLLSTVGVIVTCLLVGLFAHFILGVPLLISILLGAIVSATDAASVFSILSSKNLGLKGNLKPILEFESASNDPMSVTLTLALIILIQKPDTGPLEFILFFIKQFAIGGGLGLLIAFISVTILKHVIRLDYEGVYSVLTIGLVLFTYGLVNLIGGSPFLAVYIVGLYLGNSGILYKRNLLRYHDNISWLSQIVMFLCLGLIIHPSHIPSAAFQGLLVALFLILAARPLAVFTSLSFFKNFTLKEKILISWVGLRGAAPIILATFPLLAGIPEAEFLFYIVFFIVMASILIQGTSIPFMAQWLKLQDKEKKNIKYPIEFEKTDKIEGELNEIEIPEHSVVANRTVMELNLPDDLLIVLIYRNDRFFPASGKTILYPKDRLLVLAGMSSFIGFSMRVLETEPG